MTFSLFLKFDMESRGTRLDKEDNMTIDGAILTADSHGDKFQCNSSLRISKGSFILVFRGNLDLVVSTEAIQESKDTPQLFHVIDLVNDVHQGKQPRHGSDERIGIP